MKKTLTMLGLMALVTVPAGAQSADPHPLEKEPYLLWVKTTIVEVSGGEAVYAPSTEEWWIKFGFDPHPDDPAGAAMDCDRARWKWRAEQFRAAGKSAAEAEKLVKTDEAVVRWGRRALWPDNPERTVATLHIESSVCLPEFFDPRPFDKRPPR